MASRFLPRRVRARSLVVLLAVGLAASWTVATAPPASAHATLVTSVPAAEEVVSEPPTEVVLQFSEPVRPVDLGFTVLDPAGRAVQRDVPVEGSDRARWRIPVDVTSRGTHTVTWRVISADGHPVAGSLAFHVGRRSGTGVVAPASERVAEVLGALSRTLVLGCSAIVLGGLLIGPGSGHRRRSVLAACGVVVGSASIALARGAEASGRPPWAAAGATLRLVVDTRVGHLDAVRLALAAVLVPVVAAPRRTWSTWATGLVVVALAVATASTGHAATAPWSGLVVPLDALHLLAALAWSGAVVLLVCAGPGRDDEAAAASGRTATIALVAAPVAVASGIGLALVHVPSWSSLWSSASGRVLVAKVVVVLAALVLGFVHRRRLREGLERLHERPWSLRTEAAGLVVAVVLAAVLVGLAPPTGAVSPRPFAGTVTTPAGVVHLDVTPGGVGENRVVVHFADRDGADRAVDVAAVSIGRDGIPTRPVAVRLRGRSLVEAREVSFGAPGTWTVQVRAVYRGTSERATFEVVVR